MLTGISETQQQHGTMLAGLRHSLAEVRGTQMRHGNRLDELDAAITGVAATQARHGNRLDELETKLDATAADLHAKLDVILGRLGPGPQPTAGMSDSSA